MSSKECFEQENERIKDLADSGMEHQNKVTQITDSFNLEKAFEEYYEVNNSKNGSLLQVD